MFITAYFVISFFINRDNEVIPTFHGVHSTQEEAIKELEEFESLYPDGTHTIVQKDFKVDFSF